MCSFTSLHINLSLRLRWRGGCPKPGFLLSFVTQVSASDLDGAEDWVRRVVHCLLSTSKLGLRLRCRSRLCAAGGSTVFRQEASRFWHFSGSSCQGTASKSIIFESLASMALEMCPEPCSSNRSPCQLSVPGLEDALDVTVHEKLGLWPRWRLRGMQRHDHGHFVCVFHHCASRRHSSHSAYSFGLFVFCSLMAVFGLSRGAVFRLHCSTISMPQ